MGLTWSQYESQTFQTQLSHDVEVWKQGLRAWQFRLIALEVDMGSGPGARLTGQAWNTAKTLFIDRIQPIVMSCLSSCTWIGIHLQQYARYEFPLLDNGAYLSENNLQNSIDTLNDEIYDMTHWLWIFPSPWRNDDDDVVAARNQVSAIQRKLDELRTFARQVNGLFADEKALARSVQTAVDSINAGSISADGIYVPSIGDTEPWLGEVKDYTNIHPRNPKPVYDTKGQYGGNQGWLDEALRNGFLSDEEIQQLLDIMHKYFPDLTEDDLQTVFNQMNNVGCAYIAGINTIIEQYADNPAEFERIFGFPLYKPDGTINFDLLFTDYWMYIQQQKDASPTGTPPRNGNNNPGGFTETDYPRLEDYLASYGVECQSSVQDSVTMDNYERMKEKGAVLIRVRPVFMYDQNGNLYEANGGHAMIVTGRGEDPTGRQYLTVSSWGAEYRLYLEDYAPGVTHDTDKDGNPDGGYCFLREITYG